MCRSFLSNWINEKGEEQTLGRMNLGVVSINLPYLAYEATTLEEFVELLEESMEMALSAQLQRVERLKKVKAKNNPTMFVHGAIARLNPEETIEHLFYDGRSSISIGFVGLWECVKVWGGGKADAMEVLKLMKAKCEEFKKNTRLSFSLYGTPSESLCYKFATAINQRWPDVLGKDYITNSFHMPVWEAVSPIEKWKYEEGFANIASGGFISYIEQPSLKDNLKAYEAFVDYAYEHLPYFAINIPVDKCYECGSIEEFKATAEGFECSCCGNTNPDTISVIRRISGYLTAPVVRKPNKGKMQEIVMRIKHN